MDLKEKERKMAHLFSQSMILACTEEHYSSALEEPLTKELCAVNYKPGLRG